MPGGEWAAEERRRRSEVRSVCCGCVVLLVLPRCGAVLSRCARALFVQCGVLERVVVGVDAV